MAARKITPRYLRWVTDRYFSRYTTSTAHLRRLLRQKVWKTLNEHGGDEEAAYALVEEELVRLQGLRVLDDARYAYEVTRSMSRRGAGSRKIRAKLAQKGLTGQLVDDAFAALREESDDDPELRACATYARKRRIGPWRRNPVDREGRQKELAKLGRAGFPYDIARQVIDADDIEALP